MGKQQSADLPLDLPRLIPGSVIGCETVLTGTISLVWGKLTSIKWEGNAITCLLKATISTNSSKSSDYLASNVNEARPRRTFRLVLRPTENLESHQQGLMQMEEGRNSLLGLVGKTVTIDVSGLKVVTREKEDEGSSVYLEGIGERSFVTKSGHGVTVLAGESHLIMRSG